MKRLLRVGACVCARVCVCVFGQAEDLSRQLFPPLASVIADMEEEEEEDDEEDEEEKKKRKIHSSFFSSLL